MITFLDLITKKIYVYCLFCIILNGDIIHHIKWPSIVPPSNGGGLQKFAIADSNPINYIKEIGMCEHMILLHQRKVLFMHNTLY